MYKAFEYRFRDPIHHPETMGLKPPEYRRTIENGMLIERDVPVMMRDGVRIYVDIFRPTDEAPAPPIIAWSPYGKHVSLHNTLRRSYHYSGVNLDLISNYTVFESPDPVYWVSHGYAIIVANIRGTWYSEGNATFVSPKESEDHYDLIEWAGTQSWSNGKVGLSGVSYLSVSQWRVAAKNPPHLCAINPWEGWTDTYREVVRHGGIPNTYFWSYIQERWGFGTNRLEDLKAETEEHPFYDAFWESKSANLADIKTPAYVVASWSDHGLHTRGTLEGFKKITSEQKWLEVHGRKKWAHYYDPQSVEKQREFFDHFLKGMSTSVTEWPKVQLEARNQFYDGDIRFEKEWPIARTQYTRLYLDPRTRSLTRLPVSEKGTCDYDSSPGEGSVSGRHAAYFDIRFEEPVELIGHMKLKLFMSCEDTDDMDIFVGVQKVNSSGEIVGFPYFAQYDDGPVAIGWIRASHRELDEEATTEFQPVLKHRRELKVTRGEIIPLEIEILPSGTRFDAGESLRLVIQGTDLNTYDEHLIFARHPETVNQGKHTIYAGENYDSYLLIPIIPG